MTYQINKTNGTLLVEILDTKTDNFATDLTLIGKNTSGYGQFIDTNFVHLLENFANDSEPPHAITGQLWYDTSQNRLKVYDGVSFKTSSGPVVQATPPLNLVQGDFWIDSSNKQLWFSDGTSQTLAGPIYKYTDGVSGLTVDTVLDSNGTGRLVVKLSVANTLLGIFSKEVTPFTPKANIAGFSGEIKPGFNAGTLSGLTFNVTASKANALVDQGGNLKSAQSFMATDTSTRTVGTVTIQNSVPLILGSSQNTEIHVSSSAIQQISNTSGQDYLIKVKNSSGTVDAVTVRSINQQVGIFNSSPAYTLDVAGSFRASQSLMLPKYTSTARDNRSLSAANYGEIIYNTTTNKAQVYNGTWNDLW